MPSRPMETKEEYIERKVDEYEQEHYGGSMPAHNKSILRGQLKKEYEFNEWEARDFVPGKDDGEPPKGARW
jgi:hypothetical protein